MKLRIRSFGPWLVLLGGLLWSGPQAAAAAKAPLSPATLFHWQFKGTKALEAMTNANKLRDIWKLKETRALADQALDKLAQAALKTAKVPESESQAFRQMLSDLLESESRVLVQGESGSLNWLLAARLQDNDIRHWEKTFKALAARGKLDQYKVITGPGSTGWSAASAPNDPKGTYSVRFIRGKVWVVATGGRGLAASMTALQDQLIAQPDEVHQWEDHEFLKLDVHGKLLKSLANLRLPLISLSAKGSGDHVRLHLSIPTARAGRMVLDDWKTPHESIRNPHNSMVSFTAARGLQTWLSEFDLVRTLKVDPVPNQFFSWGQSQFNGQTIMAMPIEGPTNNINRMAQVIPRWMGQEFTGPNKVLWSSNKAQIVWQGLPMLAPFIRTLRSDNRDYLSAGMVPILGRTNELVPQELFVQLKNDKLFYYNWEITEQRLLHNRHYLQLALILSQRRTISTNSATFAWLQRVHPMLGNCITIGTRPGPKELLIERKSPIGLTGAELVLVTRWLDSPEFPTGFSFPEKVKRPDLKAKPKPKPRSGSGAGVARPRQVPPPATPRPKSKPPAVKPPPAAPAPQ